MENLSNISYEEKIIYGDFAGWYHFGNGKDGIWFGLIEKPSLIKRFFMKHLLGIYWENQSEYIERNKK